MVSPCSLQLLWVWMPHGAAFPNCWMPRMLAAACCPPQVLLVCFTCTQFGRRWSAGIWGDICKVEGFHLLNIVCFSACFCRTYSHAGCCSLRQGGFFSRRKLSRNRKSECSVEDCGSEQSSFQHKYRQLLVSLGGHDKADSVSRQLLSLWIIDVMLLNMQDTCNVA